MIATSTGSFLGFARSGDAAPHHQPQGQQWQHGNVKDELHMLGDDVLDLFEFSNMSQMVFNEPAVGGHFYPPLVLTALEADAAAAAVVAAAESPLQAQLSQFAAPAPAPLPPAPSSTTQAATSAPASAPKTEAIRTVITTPFAAAAAAAALKALPPSSTALTKRRTHNKEEQQQKRRERNRVLAKRTRLRKKFMFQSLQTQVSTLHMENERLKNIVTKHCGDKGVRIIKECCKGGVSPVVASCARQATALLQRSDFLLMKALQNSQPSFCITDPSLPDCPIVFASDGFISLTGYERQQVIGRNCRFLQGPDTDPDMVLKLRKGIEEGVDTSVFLRNYNAQGTPFWNHVFVVALRNLEGKIVNYVGIQHPVDNPPSQSLLDAVMGNEDDDDTANNDDDDASDDAL